MKADRWKWADKLERAVPSICMRFSCSVFSPASWVSRGTEGLPQEKAATAVS